MLLAVAFLRLSTDAPVALFVDSALRLALARENLWRPLKLQHCYDNFRQ